MESVSDSNQLDKPKTMEDWCELFPRGASVNGKGVPRIDVEISIKWPPPEASDDDDDDDDDDDADYDDNDNDNDGDDVGAGTKAAVKSKRVPTVAIKIERNSVKSVKSDPVNLDSGVPKAAASSTFSLKVEDSLLFKKALLNAKINSLQEHGGRGKVTQAELRKLKKELVDLENEVVDVTGDSDEEAEILKGNDGVPAKLEEVEDTKIPAKLEEVEDTKITAELETGEKITKNDANDHGSDNESAKAAGTVADSTAEPEFS